MKVLARAFLSLILTLGLAVGFTGTVSTAQADDSPIFRWTNPDDTASNQRSCWYAGDCAWQILSEINTYTRANGECSSRQEGWFEYCQMMRGLERELWQRISTWDDAQAALEPYEVIYSELAASDLGPSSGDAQFFKRLWDMAKTDVSIMFDPNTHEYLGPPPATPTEPSQPQEPNQPTDPDPPVAKSFTKTYAPTISGTAKVGKTLKAKVKTWLPKPSNITYQWYRNGNAIDGATKYSYKLVGADKGKKVTVKVTVSKSGYKTVAKTSKATKKIATGTITKGSVKISGSRKVGQTLTVKMSKKWTPNITVKYQWYRGKKKIKGATDATYTLIKSDKGKKMKVKVKVSKDGYKTVAKKSKATKKIRR